MKIKLRAPRLLVPVFFTFFLIADVNAQVSQYIIYFKDKNNSSYSISAPAGYLSQRAIDRRLKSGAPIDSTDLPVSRNYLGQLSAIPGVTLLNTSKWLNAVTVKVTDPSVLIAINALPFVRRNTAAALRTVPGISSRSPKMAYGASAAVPSSIARAAASQVSTPAFNYGASRDQILIDNGQFLHDYGLVGSGMVIGVLDGGFQNYTGLTAFDSLRKNNQILSTYDFVDRQTAVSQTDQHGTECLSIMAANLPGEMVGSAPKASFHLFRTEDDASEYPIEEFNWVCGAERLDSAGADIISSSLGYTTFDAPLESQSHTYADLNGNTTVVTIGADLAAKKGMLVVNAIGNDGNGSWKYLSAPSDGDSVLAVGALTRAGQSASFSSYGYSSDGQVKPDVVSVGAGTAVILSNNTIGVNNGTSFAAPNIAGLAACLWQGFPQVGNIRIIDALRKSGSVYTTPNDRIGYGIPNMKKAMALLVKDQATVTATVNGCNVLITWKSSDAIGMKYEIRKRNSGETAFKVIGVQYPVSSSFGLHEYQFITSGQGSNSEALAFSITQYLDTVAASSLAVMLDSVNVISNACVPNNQISLVPNPATQALKLRILMPEASNDIMIFIYNSLGQLIFRRSLTKPAGAIDADLTGVLKARGIYRVIVEESRKKIGSASLVIQ